MQTRSGIIECYRKADEETRCEMWLAYRELRQQFEAVELSSPADKGREVSGCLPPAGSKPHLLSRVYRNCRRLCGVRVATSLT